MPNKTQAEMDAHNARAYKEMYHKRGIHLTIIYTLIVGIALGAMIGTVLSHEIFWLGL